MAAMIFFTVANAVALYIAATTQPVAGIAESGLDFAIANLN